MRRSLEIHAQLADASGCEVLTILSIRLLQKRTGAALRREWERGKVSNRVGGWLRSG